MCRRSGQPPCQPPLGGRSDEANTTVTVQNASPTNLELTAPTTVEGRRVQLDGSFVDPGDDTFDIAVDWGDGESPLALSIDGTTSFMVSHVYADDDPSGTPVDVHPVTVTVTDDDRGTISGTTTVTVRNAAPTVTLANARGPEGEVLTFSGTVEDPGDDTFQAVIDWGDGTPVVERPIQIVDGTFTISHRYTDDPSGEERAAHPVTVTVTDDDTGTGTTSAGAFVTNVAPEITALTSPTGDEGAEIVIAGRLVDPGDDTFGAIVDWGDGAGPRPIQISPTVDGGFELAHTYADDGVYTVTVVVVDDDGGRSPSASTTARVRNVAPEITELTSTTVDEGSPAVLLGRLGDPGRDTFIAVVDWGDGSTDTIEPLAVGEDGGFVLDHVYADDDPTGTPSDEYVVTVRVVDDDRGVDQRSTVIRVDNVAPEARIEAVHDVRGNAIGPEERLDLTLVGLDVTVDADDTDVGTSDTHATRIDWGDDTVERDPTGATTVWTHAYRTSGDHTVTVEVVDDDGGRSTVERVVHVRTAKDVLDDLAARLEVAIATRGPDAESSDLLQDALDAIAGNGKSALAIIDGGKGDVTGPLTDAAATLESAGWMTDAELLALVGSSAVVMVIVDATPDVLSPSDPERVDQALANLAAGDSTAAPVDALGHYAAAMQELKKYL